MNKLSNILYAIATICCFVLAGMSMYYKIGGAIGYMFLIFGVVLLIGYVPFKEKR